MASEKTLRLRAVRPVRILRDVRVPRGGDPVPVKLNGIKYFATHKGLVRVSPKGAQ